MKWTILPLAAAVVASGCVSKSAYEQLGVQLEECRKDKTAAQDAAAACEGRFEREVVKWDNTEKTLSEVVPQTLQQFGEERDKILQLVPEAARTEVRSYLDDFSKSVQRGFQSVQASQEALRADNARILAELETSKQSLAAVGDTTQSIDSTLKSNLQSANQDRQRMRASAAAIVQLIQEFDQTYINEKGSDERLSLSRKEREAIMNFHARVVTSLTTLQADVASEAAAGGDENSGG